MKTMLLIKSWWQGAPTFRMIPVSKECPYAEVIYINGLQKGMAVISTIEYEKLEIIPKLDAKGMQIPIKVNGEADVEKQRISMRTLYEYQMFNKEEQIEFIKLMAVNADTFKYAEFMEMDFTPKTEEANSGIVDKDGKTPLKIEKSDKTVN